MQHMLGHEIKREANVNTRDTILNLAPLQLIINELWWKGIFAKGY